MTIRSFREQAIRAERLARSILDERASEALMELARDYWEKADTIPRERAVTFSLSAEHS